MAGPIGNVLRLPLRHWRGELPLWVSFWLGSAGVLLATGLLARLYEQVAESEVLHPVVSVRLALAYLLVAGLAYVWLAVGIWRSGRRHQAARVVLGWGSLAQIAVGCGVVFLLVNLIFQWPLVVQLARSSTHSERIDGFQIHLMEGGRALLVEGGIGWHLTDQLDAALRVHTRVTTVILDSPGGWLSEGRLLRNLLASRGLTARVVRHCHSACALAFLGAPRRELRAGAVLGLHLPSASGLQLDATYRWSEDYRKLMDDQSRMIDAGVSPEFVRRVFSTPFGKIWMPDLVELVQSGAVTRVLVPEGVIGEGGVAHRQSDGQSDGQPMR